MEGAGRQPADTILGAWTLTMLLPGLYFLIKQGLADRAAHWYYRAQSMERYLTTSCMTRYPELWAVGSAVVPF